MIAGIVLRSVTLKSSERSCFGGQLFGNERREMPQESTAKPTVPLPLRGKAPQPEWQLPGNLVFFTAKKSGAAGCARAILGDLRT